MNIDKIIIPVIPAAFILVINNSAPATTKAAMRAWIVLEDIRTPQFKIVGVEYPVIKVLKPKADNIKPILTNA